MSQITTRRTTNLGSGAERIADTGAVAMTVTPEMARKWVEAHIAAGDKNFRRRSAAAVAKFIYLIDSGGFHLTPDAVIINHDGTIQNGAHRVFACAAAKRPMMVFVYFGTVSDVGIDEQMKRTLAQHLEHAGEENCANLAASLRAYDGLFISAKTYDKSWKDSSRRSDTGSMLKLLATIPHIRESVTFNHGSHVVPFPAALAAIHCRGMILDPDHTKWWAEALKNGANLGEDDPVFRLRHRFLNPDNARRVTTRVEAAALIIKSWNLSQLGLPCRVLKFASSGPTREEFPVMNGDARPGADS